MSTLLCMFCRPAMKYTELELYRLVATNLVAIWAEALALNHPNSSEAFIPHME